MQESYIKPFKLFFDSILNQKEKGKEKQLWAFPLSVKAHALLLLICTLVGP